MSGEHPLPSFRQAYSLDYLNVRRAAATAASAAAEAACSENWKISNPSINPFYISCLYYFTGFFTCLFTSRCRRVSFRAWGLFGFFLRVFLLNHTNCLRDVIEFLLKTWTEGSIEFRKDDAWSVRVEKSRRMQRSGEEKSTHAAIGWRKVDACNDRVKKNRRMKRSALKKSTYEAISFRKVDVLTDRLWKNWHINR